VTAGEPAVVQAHVIRTGRTTTVARGTLAQGGRDRLTTLATMGDLDQSVGIGPPLQPDVPPIPPPDGCPSRSELDQGVALPILDRLDIRIDPAYAVAGGSERAVMAGWIRLHDGADPSALSLPLFADAFPPSLYALVGRVGWVPTIELTVHVRRRRGPGWVQARFECDDLADGRMIESGTLWDASGRVVARSRQLGLLLPQ
jgi:acyl-CoA thioesterase